MTSIYDRGAATAARLLAANKYGQGVVTLTRSTPGVPGPDPWTPVVPVTTTETLKAAVSGVSSALIGKEAGGTVIIASDRECVCAPPAMAYKAGDVLTIDGVPVHIIAVMKKPDAGTTSAVRFIVRG